MQNKKTYISTVEDIFTLKYGCVIMPGLPHELETVVKVGDKIEIVKPDMSILNSFIKGIEMVRATPPLNSSPILLPKNINKDDIPKQSKVYLIEK